MASPAAVGVLWVALTASALAAGSSASGAGSGSSGSSGSASTSPAGSALDQAVQNAKIAQAAAQKDVDAVTALQKSLPSTFAAANASAIQSLSDGAVALKSADAGTISKRLAEDLTAKSDLAKSASALKKEIERRTPPGEDLSARVDRLIKKAQSRGGVEKQLADELQRQRDSGGFLRGFADAIARAKKKGGLEGALAQDIETALASPVTPGSSTGDATLGDAVKLLASLTVTQKDVKDSAVALRKALADYFTFGQAISDAVQTSMDGTGFSGIAAGSLKDPLTQAQIDGVRTALFRHMPDFQAVEKLQRPLAVAAGKIPSGLDAVMRAPSDGTTAKGAKKGAADADASGSGAAADDSKKPAALAASVTKLTGQVKDSVASFPVWFRVLRQDTDKRLPEISRITARIYRETEKQAAKRVATTNGHTPAALLLDEPAQSTAARSSVSDLAGIDSEWPVLETQLRAVTDYQGLMDTSNAQLLDLRVARTVLAGALQLLEEAAGGDITDWVSDQVRIFYFPSVVRLLTTLDPTAHIVNPEGQAAVDQAQQVRKDLKQAESDLFKALGDAASAKVHVLSIQAKIPPLQAQAKSAQNSVDSASNNLTAAQSTQKAAQDALDAANKDPNATQADKDAKTATLKQATDAVTAQTGVVNDAKAKKASLDDQLAKLSTNADSELATASKAVLAAQATIVDKRNQIAQEAETEAEAFATAREALPIYFSPARAASTDPVRRVRLYAYPDSKTIYLRGRARDVDAVEELIAEYDRPAPQARITLWSLQMNGSDNRKLNDALTNVDNQLRTLRGNLTLVQDLLRNALIEEVNRWAEIAYYATEQHGSSPVDASTFDGRTSRYFFYAPEVRDRLGFRYSLPPRAEWLAALQDELVRAQDYFQAARLQHQSVLEHKPGSQRDSARQKREADLRRAGFHVDQAAAMLQSPPSEVPTSDVSAIAKRLESALKLEAKIRELVRSDAGDAAYSDRLDACKGNILTTRKNTVWKALEGAKSYLAQELAKGPSRDDEAYLPTREDVLDAEQVTAFTLPDPAHLTTLGEMMFVLSLARKESRERVLQSFLVEAAGFHESGSAEFRRFTQALNERFAETGADLLKPVHLSGNHESKTAELERMYPYFPRTILGSTGSRVPSEAQPWQLSANQLEIVLAIQAKAREAVSAEVRFLLRELDDLKGDRYSSLSAKSLREEYLPLVGWLHDGAQSPVPGEHVPERWRRAGERALGVRGTPLPFDPGTLRDMDRGAWQVAQLSGQRNSLSRATPRVAAADDLIKRLIVVAEGDLEHFFMEPAFQEIRKSHPGVEFGTLQRESLLATNRLLARIDPNANAEVRLDNPTDFLQEATQLAQLAEQVEGLIPPSAAAKKQKSTTKNDKLTTTAPAIAGMAAGQAGLSAGQSLGIAGIASLLGSLAAAPPDPPQNVYSINSGNLFKVTPVFDPSGQALRFQFDFAGTVRVREADGTTSPDLPRVERHSVNTEVQLTNLELREISRFESNSQVGLPTQKTGGIPLIRHLPVIKEIPILGYYVKSPGSKAVRQESIIFAQTSIYPTVADIVDLLSDAAHRNNLERREPGYLREGSDRRHTLPESPEELDLRLKRLEGPQKDQKQ